MTEAAATGDNATSEGQADQDVMQQRSSSQDTGVLAGGNAEVSWPPQDGQTSSNADTAQSQSTRHCSNCWFGSGLTANFLVLPGFILTFLGFLCMLLSQRWTMRNDKLQDCINLRQIEISTESCNATIDAGLPSFWRKRDLPKVATSSWILVMIPCVAVLTLAGVIYRYIPKQARRRLRLWSLLRTSSTASSASKNDSTGTTIDGLTSDHFIRPNPGPMRMITEYSILEARLKEADDDDRTTSLHSRSVDLEAGPQKCYFDLVRGPWRHPPITPFVKLEKPRPSRGRPMEQSAMALALCGQLGAAPSSGSPTTSPAPQHPEDIEEEYVFEFDDSPTPKAYSKQDEKEDYDSEDGDVEDLEVPSPRPCRRNREKPNAVSSGGDDGDHLEQQLALAMAEENHCASDQENLRQAGPQLSPYQPPQPPALPCLRRPEMPIPMPDTNTEYFMKKHFGSRRPEPGHEASTGNDLPSMDTQERAEIERPANGDEDNGLRRRQGFKHTRAHESTS